MKMNPIEVYLRNLAIIDHELSEALARQKAKEARLVADAGVNNEDAETILRDRNEHWERWRIKTRGEFIKFYLNESPSSSLN